MIPLSVKFTDVDRFQTDIMDWLRSGKPLVPALDTVQMSDWSLIPMKEDVDNADNQLQSEATAANHHALVLGLALYRDTLHAMSGRQEVKGAAWRRTLRHTTVVVADLCATQAGKPYG